MIIPAKPAKATEISATDNNTSRLSFTINHINVKCKNLLSFFIFTPKRYYIYLLLGDSYGGTDYGENVQ